jgi:hypothetical protein
MSEMEYAIRNWYHFLELGGDHVVEQGRALARQDGLVLR